MSLEPRQQRFVEEYLKDLNATEAVKRAGYSARGASVQGARLLANVSIAAAIDKAIEKRSKRVQVQADDVVTELARLGFSNILDYVTVNEDGQADIDLTNVTREQAAAISEIRVDTTGGQGDGERKLVLRTTLKLTPKTPALELLGKHLKLFTDKHELSGPEGGPVEQRLMVEFVESDAR